MAKIKIVTRVDAKHEDVINGFNRSLFLALKPPLMPMKLERFDGIEIGDKIILKVFVGVWQDWVGVITEKQTGPAELSFVDIGEKLPFFLKEWRHLHRIIDEGDKTVIVDDIHFKSWNLLSDVLVYPVLYLTFWYRRFPYKRFFKK